MRQRGVTESLPPAVGPESWPQPGDGIDTPVYLREDIITTAHGDGHSGINHTTKAVSTCLLGQHGRLCPPVPHLHLAPEAQPQDLEVYKPRQVIYLDLLGPISGTTSENQYVDRPKV